MVRPNQYGNAFFVILIAVVLFAALGFAISRTTSGSGGNVSDDKAKLLRAQFDAIASNVSAAIIRLTVNGCVFGNRGGDETQTVVGNSHWPYDPNYDTNYANHACNVYDMSVGGQVPINWGGGTGQDLQIGKDIVIFGAGHLTYKSVGTNWMVIIQFTLFPLDDVGINSDTFPIYRRMCQMYNTSAGIADPYGLTSSNATLLAALQNGKPVCYRQASFYVLSFPVGGPITP